METQLMWEALLKKCGFTYVEERYYLHGYLMHGGEWKEGYWLAPDKTRFGKLPPPTLDNCFKWVIPEGSTLVLSKGIKGIVTAQLGHHSWTDKDIDECAVTACYSALIGGEHGE